MVEKDGLKVSCSRIEGGRKEKGVREEVRGKQFKYRSMIPQLITHAAQLAALGSNRFRLKALSNAYSVTPPAACSSRFYGDLSGSVTKPSLSNFFVEAELYFFRFLLPGKSPFAPSSSSSSLSICGEILSEEKNKLIIIIITNNANSDPYTSPFRPGKKEKKKKTRRPYEEMTRAIEKILCLHHRLPVLLLP